MSAYIQKLQTKIPFEALHALGRSLLLVTQSAPTEIRRLVLLNLVYGAGPAVLLYLGKVVIDETLRLMTGPGETSPLDAILARPVLLWSIVAFLLINILVDAIETVQGFEFSSLRDRLEGATKERMYRKIAEFDDIALFESPALLDTLQLAQQSIPRLRQLANVITNLMTGIFVFIPILLLSLSIAWWVPLVIFLSAAPSIWVQLRYEDTAWSVEQAQAGTVRQMSIQERMLTGPEYAKEVRQFRLQSFLLHRWNTLFRSAFDEMRQVRKQGTTAVLGWSIMSGLGTGLPYLYVIIAAIGGYYTAGDLAIYAGLVIQVRRSLFILIGNTANLQEIALASSAIFRLLDLQPTLRPIALPDLATGPSSTRLHSPQLHTIEIANVSFRYPGSDMEVLSGIDLTLRHGEMVVIVGENGAGKTTLAKLLCRLYDPTAGVIRWDGTDIRELDFQRLRDAITVVNQDYARFPASARENIGFGQRDRMHDDDRIMRAAAEAGLRPLIERWSQGLETPLTKQLEHGLDLSGGQWQRVAIARALMRHPKASSFCSTSRLLRLTQAPSTRSLPCSVLWHATKSPSSSATAWRWHASPIVSSSWRVAASSRAVRMMN